jgi:hypothetical protein
VSDSYVYVVRSPCGRRKVGFSTDPVEHARSLTRIDPLHEVGRYEVEYTRDVPLIALYDVQRLLGEASGSPCMPGEWADRDLEATKAAIRHAVRDA